MFSPKPTSESAATDKPDESKESHRHLKGVVRVGTIVKNIFLKSDRDIHLIVLTSRMPTCEFVKRISDELSAEVRILGEQQQLAAEEAKKIELAASAVVVVEEFEMLTGGESVIDG